MQIQFVGRNIEVTEAMKQHTAEKLHKVEKFHFSISQVQVILQVEHGMHIAEATLHISGLEIHARAKEDDMYKSIDAMVDKLAVQISKHKEKIQGSH